MRRTMLQTSTLGLACAALLAAAPAFAQSTGLGTSSGSGSFSSSGLGSSGMSSSGGLGSGGLGSGGLGSSGALGSGSSGFGGSSSGGGFSGSTGGSTGYGASGGRGGTTTTPGSTSFLGSYYYNPYSFGLPTTNTTSSNSVGTSQVAFGTAIYKLTQTTTGTASINTQNSNMGNGLGAGFGIRRLPAYATTLRFAVPPPPPPPQVRADLQNMIAQTTQLDSRDSVRIVMDGTAVVLQGRVVDDDERRLVENMVRLTPGVNDVRNEFQRREAGAVAQGSR